MNPHLISLICLLLTSCQIWKTDIDRDKTFLLKIISMFFRDDTALIVTSIIPKNSSTSNYRNTNVFIGFNKNVAGITKQQINIRPNNLSTSIEGELVTNGKFIVFTPATLLLPNTTYTVSISAENGLSSSYEYQFSTGSEVDNTPPSVLSTSPEIGETNFPINAKIIVNFNESIDPTTVSESNFSLQGNPPGVLSIQDQSLLFSPNSNLLPVTAYICVIKSGIKDIAGNQMVRPYSWVFSTSETEASTCFFDLGIFGICLYE
ncbi:hypothetical protein EHQ58_12400 [Leptospira ognonensis]|uniref:SbsA Ig-like domain-containing protein n=1 Tax=Leptospira ognonensis TaxID=2484945 RepID=A0A4R9JZL1_9LEPT|nr:Ig-like domain-containing protein [Leptospira ognonensis]TGL58174.1 hypothetical protein EHQ58_12400 [Leptospira ognonensis]